MAAESMMGSREDGKDGKDGKHGKHGKHFCTTVMGFN
jgi:hypothetical protein